jgi:acyl-CoA reductase-like NAD-dependent aldehyde dehydrogenase
LALGEVILKAGWPEEALAVLPLDNADTAWLAEKEDRIKLVSFTGLGQSGVGVEGALWTQARAAGIGRECHAHRAQRLEGIGRRAHCAPRTPPSITRGSRASARSACWWNAASFQTFLWKVVEAAAKLVVGDPSNEATEVGPLIRVSEAERVETWVKGSRCGGTKLVTGGERKGSMITPAIVTATAPGMKVHDEEVFGPVLLIEPYDDFEDALAR